MGTVHGAEGRRLGGVVMSGERAADDFEDALVASVRQHTNPEEESER